MFRTPDPGTLIIRPGPQLCRIRRRSYIKSSNERVYGAGDSSDRIKVGTRVGDRFGELSVLADFALIRLSSRCVVFGCVVFLILV